MQIWGTMQRAYNDYKVAAAVNLLRQQPPEVGWSAPPSGMYKINVDGAMSEDGRPAEVGLWQQMQSYYLHNMEWKSLKP